ncbi:dnaJ homolog subfamily C member 2-like [Oppia nitens]|uniref:dnaJ homolog subfamily C member 2-like n=1 Tax=Oppia nitens TaxID=1686743 RepID=UPI0023DC246C|nr:dnaJ homolog subfamily C member 2-like [Oppia nitens]
MSRIKEMSLVKIEAYDEWLSKLLKRLGLIDINCLFASQDTSEQYLIGLDPKDWKNQDHYKIFNITKRFFATNDEIKKHYRKLVLKHHPDKRSSATGIAIDLDLDYYSCITRGYEILGDPVKRRSYDSIDPTFDDEIPSVNAYNKSHFIQVFRPVFKLNSRWSNKQPVPDLGTIDSDMSNVNNFYNFWYDFDSWREYSYLDEEEKEKGENREERRWMEKQNKAARAQRKKEEMQRLRQLVDNAYQCDPRISKYKEEEKQRKLNQKLAKQEIIRQKQLEEERVKKEKEDKERLEKLEKENQLKAKREEEKKQKEAIKKQIRKERKLLEAMFDKFDYFAENDEKRVFYLQEFDKMVKIFNLEELQTFRQEFERLDCEESKRNFFYKQIESLNSKLDSERNVLISGQNSTNGQSATGSSKKNWSYDDIQLLIKAIKLFPAGTSDRYAVIAKWVTDKSTSGVTRNHRDVISKAKELQNTDKSQTLREETNKNAYKKLEESQQTKKCEESAPSQRFDAPRTFVELNANPWNNEEQQLLEQAMKTYPSSLGTERWDLISKCIPNRSRTDCIERYKYLVKLVKSKNEAKAVIHKTKK